MPLSKSDLQSLARAALCAARQAGKMILQSTVQEIGHKEAGSSEASQVVTEVDLKAQQIIFDSLAPTLTQHDLALFSEESPDDHSRLERPYFWCIDPLDGTLPYVQGMPGYAVSIALVSRAGEPQIGVVYAPASDQSYCAILGLGLEVNEQALVMPHSVPAPCLSIYVDRSFCSKPQYEETMQRLTKATRDMGASGIYVHSTSGAVSNACQVLHTAPACYFKFPKAELGGGSLWDFAATACIFKEAGALATDIHGAPLRLNGPGSTFMNERGVLYASDATVAQCIRDIYTSMMAR